TTRSGSSCSTSSGCVKPPRGSVVGEEWADELVEDRLVAAGHRAGRQRADRRRARDVHRKGHLAEVVAGPEHPPWAELAEVRDGEEPVEHDVEPISLLALDHGRLPDRYLLSPHLLGELRHQLAGQRGEQRDLRELVGRGGGAWHRLPILPARWGLSPAGCTA